MLQWRTNGKSYMFYRNAPFSMTLKDRNQDFKVRPFYDSLTLNISKMAADTAIVTMEGE